jgi:transposase
MTALRRSRCSCERPRPSRFVHCAPHRRIHSYYERTLTDLPWTDDRVRLQLRVRQWCCRYPHGRRRLFTERLPTVLADRATASLASPYKRWRPLVHPLGGTLDPHMWVRP